MEKSKMTLKRGYTMQIFYKKKVRIFFAFALAALLVLGFADEALAQNKPNIHVGALEIHPFASVKQTYDSNIYLEPGGDENDDFITDIEVGTGLRMPLVPEREEDFMVEASYHANIIEFWEESNRSRVDHTANGLLNFNFANFFRLKIKEYFNKTANPPGSERTTLDKRYRNVLDSALAYTREKITLEGSYRFARDAYLSERLENFNKYDNMLTGTCFYQVFPKTSVLAEYNFGIISYDTHRTNSDSTYHQARFGVEGKLWSKLTGTVKAGYRYVNYDQTSKDNFSSFALFANMKYDATERTVINLSAERTSTESTYETNSYYETNKLRLSFDHQLMDRLWIDGGGIIRFNLYPDETTEGGVTKKRRDFIWSLDTGLRYEIKEWLFFNAGYEFKQRDSRFGDFDYTDHKVSASVSARF